MTSSLKKKLIAALAITIVLAVLYFQSKEREKAMNDFTKMQLAPIQEAEKNKKK